MRVARLLTLTVLASVSFAGGAAQAGEALYLTPPLFREQVRETQQVRSVSDLTTTPQPTASAGPAAPPRSAQAAGEVETTGSF